MALTDCWGSPESCPRHHLLTGPHLTPQVSGQLFRHPGCLETRVNDHKGFRDGVVMLKEKKALPSLIYFILLPLKPFILSLFSLTVNTPALPSVAWGVAGQKSLVNMNLQIVCEEESYLLMVSVETLGCKQPAPVRPSWEGQVRSLTLGNKVCV